MGRTHEQPDRTPFALFGALLFLLHPLQTESVAYIAGRSESLCGMFSCAVLCRLPLPASSKAISWARSWPSSCLFGAAVLTKEQAVVLPALFLLTDLWWNSEWPVRRRARQLETLRRPRRSVPSPASLSSGS